MIESLTLKNFRKHTDKTLIFSEDLNYLRGANEIGKSSILEAIAYAFFGTKGLRESISEVVTYGQPTNSLEVNLTFKFDGVQYSITRSPKGAEVNYGGNKVTGQTETRVFVENLFGAPTDVIMNLQFAGQNNVRGILSKGGSAAASELVEKLADLKVIETLIEQIQNQLPCGNTKALESSIATIKNSVVDVPPEPDQGPVTEAETAVKQAEIACEEARKVSESFDRADIESQLAKIAAVKAANAEKRKMKAQLESQLGLPESEPAVSKNTIEVWKTEIAQAAGNAVRRKHYATRFDRKWESQNRVDFTFLHDEAKDAYTQALNVQNSVAARVNELKKHKPGTLACVACKREFPDAAEIAKHDAEIARQLEAELLELKDATEKTQKALNALEFFSNVINEDQQIERIYNTDYWNHDTSVIPRQVSWIGAIPPETDPTYPIKEAEDAWNRYDRQVERHATVSAQVAGITFDEETDESDLQDRKRRAELALQEALSAERKLAECRFRLQQAQSSYAHALQSRDDAMRRAKEREAQIAELTATLNQMGIHNDLIKSLREARPQITAQLWNTVLGAVSHYFTSGRGTDSIVTRDSDGFKVNGKPIDGLSGSTLDMLGLAIRLALSKVFLPNVDMFILDESFAACDTERELQGLATLASANFSQIVVVSHSAQGESLATNLIQL